MSKPKIQLLTPPAGKSQCLTNARQIIWLAKILNNQKFENRYCITPLSSGLYSLGKENIAVYILLFGYFGDIVPLSKFNFSDNN